ncbi:MAG: LysM peptidoglycan-binding domain-containing protein [Planctomycetes bacterium]|nr:LysM peptidoglycan-binding domain-containing protein [Planctomycetota bacterium]
MAARGQYTFRDFLRERGEDSLADDDRVAARNVLREIKMGLSAMAVLSVLIVVLFHESGSRSADPAPAADSAEPLHLTVRNSSIPPASPEAPSPAAVSTSDVLPATGQAPASRSAVSDLPPTPAPQDRRSGQSAVSPPGPAVPAPSESASYMVASGDTLGAIAQKLYGSTRYWRKLAEFNGISDPARLRAGRILKVPPLETLQNASPPSSESTPSAPRTRPPQRQLPPPVEIDGGNAAPRSTIPCI